MNGKTIITIAIILAASFAARSQAPLNYQVPPEDIVRIADAPATPLITVSPDKSNIVIIEVPPLASIAELSADELRIAGLRIDPATNGRSRQTFYKGFRIMSIDGSGLRDISGLPDNPRFGYPVWSPDGKRFAFTNTRESQTDLWICDITTLTASRIADRINTVFGTSVSWMPDSRKLVFLAADPGRAAKPVRGNVPEGPVVQENLGRQGQAATFQDLLKDPADEEIFEYYAGSRIMVWDGATVQQAGKPGLFTGVTPSPDGEYLLVTEIKRPFSYIVPYYYFPSATAILDTEGNMVRLLYDKPLTENLPRGYDMVLPGPRSWSWRDDAPATIYWVEALDGGDYAREMKFHDQVYILPAPFTGTPQEFISTEMRFGGIVWGREDFAMISEGLNRTRVRITSSFNPADPQNTRRKIHEYKTDDRYNNPGRFVTEQNRYGRDVLLFADRGRSLFLTGAGSSPEGDRPFIDRYDIAAGRTVRLWRSEAPWYENVTTIIDINKNLILTSRQSVVEVPDYYIRNLRNGRLTQVTRFENPYPQLAGVHKELVQYKRNDGLDLSFTLYLPAGYRRGIDKPLPTLLWAYPREFNDPSAAGQVSGSPYTFTRISPASALVYLTQDYAILMDASFPIVGVDGREPNDTFVEQLVANAEAAINKAVEMGVTDRNRVAVSGHSYGAFMTANLLSHSRLFAAGIAESGAYNRTLTPFGFQNERRSYWEAPEIYNTMSPFMHADKVKDPILLVHGMADNNSGTFPIQSERYYAALKGFGAVTRLVMLPMESHGYAARESILHKHWEVLEWMDKYVKNRKIE